MAEQNNKDKITHVDIRMYRMGTGDCFALIFYAGDTSMYKMMIDCGVWQGKQDHLEKYVLDLKEYLGSEIDVLVVTHQHKDHVYVFEACSELFTKNFKAREIWMGWPENDKSTKVKQWKKQYGEKKAALAMASEKLKSAVDSQDFKNQFALEAGGLGILAAKQSFASVVQNFTDLHVSSGKQVKEDLEGMRIVKEEIEAGEIKYFSPGDIIDNIEKATGIRFLVLGPPLLYEQVKVEEGKDGESYSHNKELAKSDAFAAAISSGGQSSYDVLAFDNSYATNEAEHSMAARYRNKDNAWRNIDYDWLNSAGSLALRMNSITNNLSLVLALEFKDSGRVVLLPGDAEYGSWASWHNIKWNEKSRDEKKPFMEDLLNRTVFYKVAHHLSHHGTAKKLGMEMMTNKDLVAMATLDYDVISNTWTSTMPNSDLIKALLNQTKGRIMITNEKGLFYDAKKTTPLTSKIQEARKMMSKAETKEFEKYYVEEPLYYQYTIHAT
ncbi:MAG: hypothetical protein JWO92_681 [Chitinophagaceae bacterium]|nr:hypothetical protein [Chitinophagaceae bacterium]MDB5222386.1 hypothetical protein [Chitinophagaceae bacterium]